jgi:hypothetical protein
MCSVLIFMWLQSNGKLQVACWFCYGHKQRAIVLRGIIIVLVMLLITKRIRGSLMLRSMVSRLVILWSGESKREKKHSVLSVFVIVRIQRDIILLLNIGICLSIS